MYQLTNGGHQMHNRIIVSCLLFLGFAFIASYNPVKAQKKSASRVTSGGWKFSTKANPMDNKKTLTLTLVSDKPILGHSVILKLECGERPPSGEKWSQMVWFIYEPDFNSELFKMPSMQWQTSSIRIRFDNTEPDDPPNIHERKDRGVFLMGAEEFVTKLLGSQKLLLEFSPRDRPKQIASFTVGDIKTQIKKLPCYSE
jgi:hypothetical protein